MPKPFLQSVDSPSYVAPQIIDLDQEGDQRPDIQEIVRRAKAMQAARAATVLEAAQQVASECPEPHHLEMDEKRLDKMESDLALARADMRVASSGIRADMAEFKQTVQASIAEQRVASEKARADNETFRGEMKTLFGDLRADMHKSQSEMKGWVVATVLAILFGFAALVFRLPGNPPATPATAPVSAPASEGKQG